MVRLTVKQILKVRLTMKQILKVRLRGNYTFITNTSGELKRYNNQYGGGYHLDIRPSHTREPVGVPEYDLVPIVLR